MSVISCKAEFQSQSYKGNEKWVQGAKLSWYITTNDKNDGPITVANQAPAVGPNPLPVQWQQYQIGNDFSQYLRAKTVDLARIPNSNTDWRGVVEYDNSLDIRQSDPNPLNRLPIDNWPFAQFQRPLVKDQNGNAIVTAAGELYDPAPEIDDSRPALVYTRNEASYPLQILIYQDTINSDPFLVFDPYTAKLNITADKKYENGYQFYEVVYSFHFRYDTWRLQGLNQGQLFYRKSSSTIASQLPAGSKPVLLAADGTILSTGQPPTFQTIKAYREVPFAPLNIIIY